MVQRLAITMLNSMTPPMAWCPSSIGMPIKAMPYRLIVLGDIVINMQKETPVRKVAPNMAYPTG